MNEAIRMQLSAFVDGELPDNEAELLLRRLSQDAELRQQVAEFMAIGRAMRGDVQVMGVDRLRERVADSLDAVPAIADEVIDEPVVHRFVRPLAGISIAATVALVAIFGLRQIAGGDVGDGQDPQLAGSDTPAAYTQQDPEDILEDDLLREMRLRHDAAASDQSINTRLTTVIVPTEAEDVDADEESLDGSEAAEDATLE